MAFDPPWFKTSDAYGKIAYDLVAPLVLTLLPAGHPPGKYLIVPSGFITTAGAAGALVGTLGWNLPVVGATTSTLFSVTAAATGMSAINARAIESNGVAALTLTLSGSGVTGSPIARVNANAIYMGPLITTP